MNDQIYFTGNRQTSCWIIDSFTCRIQTSNSKTTEQISSWAFAKLVGRCTVGPTRIFSVSRSKWRESLKMLGIQLPPRNLNRITAGLKTSWQNLKRGAEGPGREKLKAIGEEIL